MQDKKLIAGKSRKLLFIGNSAKEFKIFRGELVKFLLSHDFEISIVIPFTDNEADLIEGVSYSFIRMNRQGTNLFTEFSSFRQVYRAIKYNKPDFVISYTIKPNIYGAIAGKLLGVPSVSNITGFGSLFITRSWINPLVKTIYRFALWLNIAVVVLNREDRDELIEKKFVANEKVFLINGEGVNEVYFDAKNFAEKESGQSRFIFLFIGRIIKEKGILEYIEAARLFTDSNPGQAVLFRIIGDIDTGNRSAVPEDVFLRLVESVRSVQYLGYHKNIGKQIAEADCIVQPSYREGVPRVLLEAAALSKPIVASDVVGCREIVKHGYNGLLCKPADPAALAAAMLEICRLPDSRLTEMGENGRKMILSTFSSTIINAKYLDIIQELAHKTGKWD